MNDLAKIGLKKIGDEFKKTADTAQKQFISSNEAAEGVPSPETASASNPSTDSGQNVDSQKSRDDFIQAMYGTSEQKKEEPKPDAQVKQPTQQDRDNQEYIQAQMQQGKTLEAAWQMLQERNKLHKEYYDSVFNRPKKPEEEEHQAIKVQKQEEEELWQKQKKQEKEQKKAVPVEATKSERRPGAG